MLSHPRISKTRALETEKGTQFEILQIQENLDFSAGDKEVPGLQTILPDRCSLPIIATHVPGGLRQKYKAGPQH